LLAGGQVAAFIMLRTTAPGDTQGDPFDSPLFVPWQAVTVLLAGFLSWRLPSYKLGALWVACSVTPFAIGVHLMEVLEPRLDASFWALGLTFFWLPTALVAFAASIIATGLSRNGRE
jgi:hypothetical protein